MEKAASKEAAFFIINLSISTNAKLFAQKFLSIFVPPDEFEHFVNKTLKIRGFAIENYLTRNIMDTKEMIADSFPTERRVPSDSDGCGLPESKRT